MLHDLQLCNKEIMRVKKTGRDQLIVIKALPVGFFSTTLWTISKVILLSWYKMYETDVDYYYNYYYHHSLGLKIISWGHALSKNWKHFCSKLFAVFPKDSVLGKVKFSPCPLPGFGLSVVKSQAGCSDTHIHVVHRVGSSAELRSRSGR